MKFYKEIIEEYNLDKELGEITKQELSEAMGFAPRSFEVWDKGNFIWNEEFLTEIKNTIHNIKEAKQ